MTIYRHDKRKFSATLEALLRPRDHGHRGSDDSAVYTGCSTASFKRESAVIQEQSHKHRRQTSLRYVIVTLIVVVLLAGICMICYWTLGRHKTRPNVLILLADDLGWGDVGWHNSDINTPTLTELGRKGVILTQFYSQPICTASRAALLTGRYPFKLGLQGSRPILAGARGSLPLDAPMLPRELQKVGYKTHLIGKWHLGYETIGHTPIMRGFDTFTGFYNGMQDYFTHTTSGFDTIAGVGGYDMRNDHYEGDTPVIDDILWDMNGTFNGYVFDEAAHVVIQKHDKSNPLCLVMAYPNPHTPIQVPDVFVKANDNIVNSIRRTYAGLVSAMDSSVYNITQALQSRDMLDNTLIIFVSDNGGTLIGMGNAPTGSTNYPLRGEKGTLWEGGSRVPAFFSGVGIPSNKVLDEIFHITDIFPTLLDMLDIDTPEQLDGVKQTPLITQDDTTSDKRYFIYDIDPVYKQAAIRFDNWKLILGFGSLKLMDGWYPPLVEDQATIDNIMGTQEFVKLIFGAVAAYTKSGETCTTAECFYPGEVLQNVLLYDLSKDQYEFNNVAPQNLDVVKQLLNILDEEMKEMVAPVNLLTPGEAAASPNNFNGTWHPWL